MNKLLRLLHHRRWDDGDARRALNAAALGRLTTRVAESESHHSGEIRVCVEPGLPLSYIWRHAAARERAVALFGKLRVWDTAHNNGVLIYLLLAERRIEIVADRGLDAVVHADEWAAVAASMAEAFAGQHFEAGLLSAIDTVDSLLVRHYALAPGEANPNELPDEPVLV
ncbi:MAG: hypothetical protein JWQ11_4262 [Rhizobacter sp.]|nr:hypothetical protein [Rhizobacter sp.]